MIIIKRETEFSNNRSVVLILGKSSSKKSEVYPQISKEFAERFLASEKKFDYVKSEDQYIFLVKEDQKAEELRITGSNIQALIAESIQEISVLGKEKSVIFLAEGIALANYQFNRFLTKAKVNKLQTILVQENVEEEKITELNNTIKSVYWTRNVVNTPVSHLNATQLAEELVGLGKEAGFSVQVLEKTQIESLKMGGQAQLNLGDTTD
jgi:leucyl aminopeptidase